MKKLFLAILIVFFFASVCGAEECVKCNENNTVKYYNVGIKNAYITGIPPEDIGIVLVLLENILTEDGDLEVDSYRRFPREAEYYLERYPEFLKTVVDEFKSIKKGGTE